MNEFYFAPLSNIEMQNFDNSLEHFHAAGIEGTIRENIQNSIDAKCVDFEGPVHVNIELSTIKKQYIPGIYELEKHIDSLVGGSSYTTETIEHMKKNIKNKTLSILTFEDLNTNGLSGAELNNEESTYNIFAYKKGVHSVTSDQKQEITRGGSHGVGKIANNAASDIHLMYFANCDEYGNQHVGGTIQLIEHESMNKRYRATGYFAGYDNQLYRAYKNQGYHQVFTKNTRGLKIITPYLREEYNDLSTIVRAVCNNFFLAVLEDRLVVQIEKNSEKIEVNKDNLQQIMTNTEYYPQNLANIEDIKKVFTPLYVENYLTQEPQSIEVSSKSEKYKFQLYFYYNQKIKVARVGIVRSMGMKIIDYKVPNNVRKPFNAILIGGPKEDQFLKSLENESHTGLSAESLRSPESKKDAKKFLKELNVQITNRVNEEFERLNPSDSKIDTKDLFYKTVTSFRSHLEIQSEKVEVSKGKSLRKKKTKEKRKSKENPGENPKDPATNKVRKPRKIQPTGQEETQAEIIIAPNELVQRIVLENKEILHFNFVDVKEIIPIGKVNIGLRVVDGDGKEYDYEFDMVNSYKEIEDTLTHKILNFNSYMIHDVPVIDSQISLQLTKRSKQTDGLKFIYKVEVLS